MKFFHNIWKMNFDLLLIVTDLIVQRAFQIQLNAYLYIQKLSRTGSSGLIFTYYYHSKNEKILVAPIWFSFKILWWNTYNFNLSSPPSNFPWEAISLMACSRHLTSSVGVKVKAQKNAAPLPERAFSMGVRWATSLLPRRAMMAFWHSP